MQIGLVLIFGQAAMGPQCLHTYGRTAVHLNFRPDFTSNLAHGLAFRTPIFYIAPYSKINHRLVNLSCNCDMKIRP